MKLMFTALFVLVFPFTLKASNQPTKLYTNLYDGLIGDVAESHVSFFKKGNSVVSLDWEAKKEVIHNCELSKNKFSVSKISRANEIYLLTQQDAAYYDRDAWILDRTGNCFNVSSLTKSFLPIYGFDYAVSDSIYYSDEAKLLAIATNDYGKKTLVVDPKTKTIVSSNDTRFVPGINAREHDGRAYRSLSRKINGGYAYSLQIFDTKKFTFEESVDLGPIYISKIYFKASEQMGLKDEFLISAADKDQRTFLGTFNKTTHVVTQKFYNSCFGPQVYPQLNLVACYDTPPGGPWAFYIQNLATGEMQKLWSNLWYEPLFSEKNELIVSNLQNGSFQVYDLKTKTLTDLQKSSTQFMFFDKSEDNIVSVSHNWNGIVTISKFSIKNAEPAQILYQLQVGENNEVGWVQFDSESNKLFLLLQNNEAYYLDIK